MLYNLFPRKLRSNYSCGYSSHNGIRRHILCNNSTSCNNSAFFSYRADGGTTGRHGAFAYLTKE